MVIRTSTGHTARKALNLDASYVRRALNLGVRWHDWLTWLLMVWESPRPDGEEAIA
jgi:hypothetical protein